MWGTGNWADGERVRVLGTGNGAEGERERMSGAGTRESLLLGWFFIIGLAKGGWGWVVDH